MARRRLLSSAAITKYYYSYYNNTSIKIDVLFWHSMLPVTKIEIDEVVGSVDTGVVGIVLVLNLGMGVQNYCKVFP